MDLKNANIYHNIYPYLSLTHTIIFSHSFHLYLSIFNFFFLFLALFHFLYCTLAVYFCKYFFYLCEVSTHASHCYKKQSFPLMLCYIYIYIYIYISISWYKYISHNHFLSLSISTFLCRIHFSMWNDPFLIESENRIILKHHKQ